MPKLLNPSKHARTPRLNLEEPPGEDSCSDPAHHHLSQNSSRHIMISISFKYGLFSEPRKIYGLLQIILYLT